MSLAEQRREQRAGRIAEMVRRRINGRIAEEYLTHEQVAERLQQAADLLIGPHHSVKAGPRKVGHVVSGETPVQLDELELWALALACDAHYLLGSTEIRGGNATPPGGEGTTLRSFVAQRPPAEVVDLAERRARHAHPSAAR